MGTYKVIQDIEAEDKLLGPLSLRQFIYAIIVIVLGFIAFQLSRLNPLVALPLLPPMIFFAVLAAPFSRDQSSEVWLLARIRFFLKPRRRIWDQSGIKELVTITVPKKIEKRLTNDLSQTEVKSRLEALASTIDSRGWAVKNVNANLFAQPAYALSQPDSDRLIDPSAMAQEVPTLDASGANDVLDVQSSRAQALDQMIATSTQAHKQQLAQTMQQPQTPPADYWFMQQQAPTAPGMASFGPATVRPGQATQPSATPSTDEQALLQKIHEREAQADISNTNLKTLQPLGAESATTAAPKPNIVSLANNNDLNIETIARQANKKADDDGEVVISLH